MQTNSTVDHDRPVSVVWGVRERKRSSELDAQYTEQQNTKTWTLYHDDFYKSLLKTRAHKRL